MFAAQSLVLFLAQSFSSSPLSLTIIINSKRSTMQLIGMAKFVDSKWTKIKILTHSSILMISMTLSPQGAFLSDQQILCQVMSSGWSKTHVSWKVMSPQLLSQLPISKFSGRLLPSWKLTIKKQASLQGKPFWKMELPEGHWTPSLGRSYFGGPQSSCHAYWFVLAENRHLACNCLSGRTTHCNSCHFHHVKSYNPFKGIRLGYICRFSLLDICVGLLILPDSA